MDATDPRRVAWRTAVRWLPFAAIVGSWYAWSILRWLVLDIDPNDPDPWREIVFWALPMALGFAALLLAPACLLLERRPGGIAFGLGVAVAAYLIVAWLIGRVFDLKPPIVAVFTCLYALLLVLSATDLFRPTVPRRGLLPMTTTRGDRVFLSILVLVAATITWLIFVPELGYRWVAATALAAAAVILRWG